MEVPVRQNTARLPSLPHTPFFRRYPRSEGSDNCFCWYSSNSRYCRRCSRIKKFGQHQKNLRVGWSRSIIDSLTYVGFSRRPTIGGRNEMILKGVLFFNIDRPFHLLYPSGPEMRKQGLRFVSKTLLIHKWRVSGSNRRPLACHASALAN